VHDAGNSADLFPIIDGKEVGKRDLVTRHDAKRGVRRSLVDVEAPPDTEHDAEQEEGKRDAGNRQQTAALVAKGGLGTKCVRVMAKEIFYTATSSRCRDGACPVSRS